ncbi:hypothetical protein BJX68DRAFT_272645 [Aspergillus pseudodeflectus]|uniref:Uncharacterized protein n=1 Tax=Aspergillus pseudodeflectus TaxID=176178 RepID=A0ABR4JE38_9EURO
MKIRRALALTLGLALPATIIADPKDPLDVLGNIEALASLKQFVSIASSLSSLVEDTTNSNKEGGSPLDKLANLNFNLNPNAPDSDPDPDSNSDPSAPDPLGLGQKLQVLSQMKHVAGIASTLLDVIGERDPATSERLKNLGQPSIEEETPVDVDQIDILGGIRALQQFASLASGLGSVLDVDALIDKKKKSEPGDGAAEEREGRGAPPPPKAQRQATSKQAKTQKTQKGNVPPAREPVDFLARLDAIKTITTLASKLSALTDPASDIPLVERVQRLMNDPDVNDAFQYMYSNAGKVFTPEVLEAAKAFIRTSNLVPPEYREFAVAVLETMGAVFSPKFAKDYAQAMGTIAHVGIDFAPIITAGYDIFQWVMKTFDPEYIRWMNREVLIWKKAITSPQMGMLTSYLADPETLASVTGSIERIKRALTADRIHRLHKLFEEEGLFDIADGEYKEFGGHLGARFRWQFTTEEGLDDLKRFLAELEELIRTGALDVAARVMQMRAPVVAPQIAGDIHALYTQSTVVVDILSKITEALHDFVNIMHPLLEFEVRAEKVTSSEFWSEVSSVLEKFSAIPVASFSAVNGLLVTLARVLDPEHTSALRLLILDAVGTLSEPRVFGSVPFNVPGNVSGVVLGGGLEMLGLVETPPVLEADDLGSVLNLLHRLEDALGPSEVEKARETLLFLNKGSRFILRVVQVFECEELGALPNHDEL